MSMSPIMPVLPTGNCRFTSLRAASYENFNKRFNRNIHSLLDIYVDFLISLEVHCDSQELLGFGSAVTNNINAKSPLVSAPR
jgi:hypothetical protein